MAHSNGYGAINPPEQASTSNGVSSGADSANLTRSKILLVGQRRAGKTSILQFLFNNLGSKQTFYLETTTRVTTHTFDTIIPLELWDCPGITTIDNLNVPLAQFSTIVFVFDIQDITQVSIARFVDFATAAYQDNPSVNLEVFAHKADTLSEEYRIDSFRHIQQRVTDELVEIALEYEQIPINFQLTSILDNSLHEAFSRVIHRLIDSLPYLEDLMNVFCANSQSSKAFLFDIKSRLYVATDASPVDTPTHNLCSDYLHMLSSFGPLYRSITASPPRHRVVIPSPPSSSFPSSPISAPTHLSPPNSLSQTPTPRALPPLPPSPIASSHRTAPSIPTSPAVHPSSLSSQPSETPKSKNLFYPSASTSLSPSSSGSGTTLTYHLITPQLALLSLIPTPVFETRRGLVEYNVVFFREGVQEICEVEEEARKLA